jgi:hypothetical protein
MKKLLTILLLFCAVSSIAQLPITQNLGSDSTLIRIGNNSKGALRGSLIPSTYTDTTQANAGRIDDYPFAIIATSGDGNTWQRNYLATGWVLIGGGSDPSGLFFKVGGNLFPVTVPSRNIGTLAPYGGAIGLMTNSVVHAIVPDAGFTLSNDTTSTKIFTINPTTKEWGYANWNNGGGGSTPTLQQVLTAGSTLTDNNTIDVDLNNFTIDRADQLNLLSTGFSTLIGTYQEDDDNVGSYIGILRDSVRLEPLYGRLNIDSMRTWSAVADTQYKKPMTWDTRNGRWEYASNWFGGGGGSQNLQQVTDVGNTTTNSIQVGDSLRVQGGTDPFVAMKQATTNQEYRLRVGVGTGLSSQSFSLYDATAGVTRMVMTATGNLLVGGTSAPSSHSRILVQGGASGANIDALPDSTQLDESNIEVMGADYYGSSFPGYGVAMQFNGNANTGSIVGYSKKNFGQLRFTGVTNMIRVIPNASLRFAVNNIEKAALDSNGRFGVGARFPTSWLQVEDSSGSIATGTFNANESRSGNIVEINQAGVNKFAFHTDGSIKMADQTVAPSTPSSGYGALYSRADSLRFKNDAGTEFTLGRSTGSSASPAGNFGNIQLNRNGAFATPGSDSLDFESATGLSVKGNVNVTGLINAADGSSGNPSITFSTSDNEGFWLNGTGNLVMSNQNQNIWQTNTAAMRILNTVQVNWASGDPTATGADVGIARDAAGVLRVTNGSTGVGDLKAKGVTWSGRVLDAQGADVASANNLSLGTDGNAFEITGTTTINLISNTNWQNGSVIRLAFSSSLTVTNNAGTSGSNINILLAGGANFSATANDILTLMLCEIGGTQNWVEVSRSVN